MTATRQPAAKPFVPVFAVDRVAGPGSVFVTVAGDPYHAYTTAAGGEVVFAHLFDAARSYNVACVGGRAVACTCRGWKRWRKCKHVTGTRTLFALGDMTPPTDAERPEGWMHTTEAE